MHFVLYEAGTVPHAGSLRLRGEDAEEVVRHIGYTMTGSYLKSYPSELGGRVAESYTLADREKRLYTLDREFPLICVNPPQEAA